eukprot:3390398-Lingulodinium_polyedra.AAC.1
MGRLGQTGQIRPERNRGRDIAPGDARRPRRVLGQTHGGANHAGGREQPGNEGAGKPPPPA